MRKVVALWVRVKVAPEDIAGRLAGRGRHVCYVLEHDSCRTSSPLRMSAWNAACRGPRAGSISAR